MDDSDLEKELDLSLDCSLEQLDENKMDGNKQTNNNVKFFYKLKEFRKYFK